MPLGQVQISLGLISQETQVTHMHGLSPLDRRLTLVWELGCTFLEEEIITGLQLHPHRETERICVIKHFNRQNNFTDFSGHMMVEIQEFLRVQSSVL